MRTQTYQGTRYYGEMWWTRERPGTYTVTEKGIRYELEKRRRNTKDGTADTGWYLYGGDRFGDWAGRTLPEAIAGADEMVLEDLYDN